MRIRTASSILPSAYKQVEYIQLDHDYIDTGIVLDTAEKINAADISFTYCNVEWEESGRSNHLFGARGQVDGTNYELLFFTGSSSVNGVNLRDTYFGGRVSVASTMFKIEDAGYPELYRIYNFHLNNMVVTVTDLESNTTLGSVTLSPMSVGISNDLRINGDKGHQTAIYATSPNVIRVYDVEVKGIAHMIPCYRISDNKPGMYDTIRQQFYTSAGTGASVPVDSLPSGILLPAEYERKDFVVINNDYIDTGLCLYTNNSTGHYPNIRFTFMSVKRQTDPNNKYLTNYLGMRSPTLQTANDIMLSSGYYNNKWCVYADYFSGTQYVSGSKTEITPGTKYIYTVINRVATLKNLVTNTNVFSTTFGTSSVSQSASVKTLKINALNVGSDSETIAYSNNSVKIYDFEIDGESHMIPCIRKSDNKAGLYDIVRNQFFTNAANGTIVAGIEGVIPDEYQQLDHVRTNHDACVLSGTLINDFDRVTSKLTLKDNSGSSAYCLFGSRMEYSGYEQGKAFYFRTSANDTLYALCDKKFMGSWGTYTATTAPQNELSFYDVKMSSGNTYAKLNETIFAKGTFTYTDPIPNYRPIAIFAHNYENVPQSRENISNICDIECQYMIFHKGDVTVANFIPCYRKSDNEIGLFDLVSYTFYTNVNEGGEFIKGSDVNPLPKKSSIEGTLSVSTMVGSSSAVRLPGEYQEIAYLQSGYGAYIETNYMPPNPNGTAPINIFARVKFLDDKDAKVFNAGTYGSNLLQFQKLNSSNGRHLRYYNYTTSGNGTWTSTDAYVPGSYIRIMTSVGSCMINGVGNSLSNTRYTPTGNTLRILRNTNTEETTGLVNLYEFKIFQEGIVIKDFVPCYRKSDHELGLFDLVNNEFFSNAGTGSFSMGEGTELLPEEYQQVEYIRIEDNSASIPIGLEAGNSNVSIDFDFQAVQNTSVSQPNRWMVSAGSLDSAGNGVAFGYRQGQWANIKPGNSWGLFGTFDYNRHLINWTITRSSGNSVISGDLSNTQTSTAHFGTNKAWGNRRFILFGNSAATACPFIIYHVTFKLDNVLVRDLVPCYRKSDNEPGMYDIVNNVFYPKDEASLSSFTVGPNVSNVNGDVTYNEIEYIHAGADSRFNAPFKPLTSSFHVDFDVQVLNTSMDTFILYNNDMATYGRGAGFNVKGGYWYNPTPGSGYDNNRIGTITTNRISSTWTVDATTGTSTFTGDLVGSITDIDEYGANASSWRNNTFNILYLGPTTDINIYSFKFYKADELILDYIPVVNNITGEPCLLNGVDKLIYSDFSSGNVSSGPVKSTSSMALHKITCRIRQKDRGLPKEYQEVDYIESTGFEYIDTGITPTEGFGFYIDCTPLTEVSENVSSTKILGSSKMNGGNWGGPVLSTYPTNYQDGQFVWFRTSSSSDYSGSFWYNPGLVGYRRVQMSDINNHFTSSTGQDFNTPYTTDSDVCGSLYLFGVHNENGAYIGAPLRLYNCKLYDGDEVVRDFIPCYRKEDNVVGLYDIVNDVFYTNGSNDGAFIAGKILPDEYQELQYIESTGTQYINTGLVLSNYTNPKIYFDGKLSTNYSSTFMLGTTNYISSDNHIFHINYSSSTNVINIAYDYIDYTQIRFETNTFSVFDKHIYYCEYKNNTFSTRVDTSTYSNTGSYSGLTPTYPLYLFARNTAGTATCSQTFVYDFKFYDGNTLIMRLVPCYRKSDNVIGMYDSISKVFYTNAGTGTFIAGPLMDNPPARLPEEYQEVTELIGTGTQQIDTGYVPTANTKVETVWRQTEIPPNEVVPNYDQKYANYSGMVWGNAGWLCWGSYGYEIGMVSLFCTGSRQGLIINNDVKWHNITVSNGLQLIDANKQTNTITDFTDTPLSLYLFAGHVGWTEPEPWGRFTRKQSFRYVKIYENNVLSRNLIPCYRKSDDVAGLYDLINNVFYTNTKTGNFEIGSSIVQVDSPKYSKTRYH